MSLVPGVRKHDASMDWMAEDTGVELDIFVEDGMEDYMT